MTDPYSCVINKIARHVRSVYGADAASATIGTIRDLLGVSSLEGFTHKEQIMRINRVLRRHCSVLTEGTNLKDYLADTPHLSDYVNGFVDVVVPTCINNGLFVVREP